jgi:FixJ family two-component response regulator
MTQRAPSERRFHRITGEEVEAHRLVRSLATDECQVLAGIVAGNTLRTIASEMGISEPQAEAALAEILRKFAVRTTADLVRIGIYAGYDPGTR